MIQATLLTQQMILASGKSVVRAGSLAVQAREVSKMTSRVGLVVRGEQPAQQPLAGRAVDERSHLGTRGNMRQHGLEQARDGRAHAGRKARILPQDGGQQGSSPNGAAPK